MTGPVTVSGPWLTAPETAAVMDALAAGGGEDVARFVGGCVRNALIGAPVADVDIATALVPETVIARIEAAGLKAVPTGLKHGTITAVANHRPFEITTLRHDLTTDGRHAEVAFTDDWTADAARRDFTMNALYADRTGRVIAPVGGIDDARAGHVIFVGDPHARIREDYLRILRFFRFHAWYGRGEPDGAALAACAALKGGMTRLSAERMGREVLKLLGARDPAAAVAAMADTGVLAAILPGPVWLDALSRAVGIEEGLAWNPGPLRRIVALTGGSVDGLADRLRLSGNQGVHLAGVAALAPLIEPAMSDLDARTLLYRNGRAVWRDAVVAAWARAGDPPGTPRWGELAALSSWDPPVFPVRGRDLERIGIPPGPALGGTLKDLERRWIQSGFTLDRDALLALVTVP